MTRLKKLILLFLVLCTLNPQNIYSLAPRSRAGTLGRGRFSAIAGFRKDTSKDPKLPAWLQSVTTYVQEHKTFEPPAVPNLPFPNIETGAGVKEPEWLELQLSCAAILGISPVQDGEPISLVDLRRAVMEKFKMHKLQFSNSKFIALLNKLRANDILSGYPTNQQFASVRKSERVVLNLPPRMLAVWADDTVFIGKDLKRSLAEGTVAEVLSEYAQVASRWPQYPVEIDYPMLQAIVVMDEGEQKKIYQALNVKFGGQHRLPLIDAILLLFGADHYPEQNYIKQQVAELEGRRIYMCAPEISLLAGGWGRLMLYHGCAMKEL